MDVLGRVVYEAICPPPPEDTIIKGARKHCPISDRQFKVAGAEQVDFTLVQDQVRAVLEDTVVVGFDIVNDLKVLGITLPPGRVRDVQRHFDAKRCSEPDLRDQDLPTLDGQRPKHNLTQCLLHRSIQEGPHTAMEDAMATMDLYLWDRGRIEQGKD